MPITKHLTDVDGLPPAPGYSQAVVTTGRLAFVAGQVAFDRDGGLVGAGDLEAQVRQTLANLGRVLASLGVDWRHVVRLNWYLLDASQVQLVRAVRDEVIGPALGDDPPPASTLVQVAGLFRPEFLVEVDAVVSLPDEHS